MQQPFMEFENETDIFDIANLQITNWKSSIEISGSLDLTKDTEGLNCALKLKRIIDAAIDALRRDKNLPEHIDINE